MPLYRLVCKNCGAERPSSKTTDTCKKCQGEMLRATPKTTSKVVETIDNGFMPKRVERMKDIVEIMHDRAQKQKEPK